MDTIKEFAKKLVESEKQESLNRAFKAVSETFALRAKIKEIHSTGATNREIASQLGVHHGTVARHLEKLGLESNFANEPIDIVSNDEARCKKCQQIRPLNEFQYGRKGQKYEYRFSFCNGCRKKQVYLNLNSDVNKFLSDRYHKLVLRAKKKNIPCLITKEEFIAQYHAQKGLCFYTDAKLVCEVGTKLHRDSLSVDKLIPEKGYCAGNVVFTTHRINTCKCDLSIDELRQWMPDWFYRIKLKELADQIRRSTPVNLVLSFDDAEIDDYTKWKKGGFTPSTNPPSILIPTHEYLSFGDTYRRLGTVKAETTLYVLAHEFGHYQSWASGNWTESMVQLEEEKIAWAHALTTLASLLGKDFDIESFFLRRNADIRTYEQPDLNSLIPIITTNT
jgi:hypothetical protein